MSSSIQTIASSVFLLSLPKQNENQPKAKQKQTVRSLDYRTVKTVMHALQYVDERQYALLHVFLVTAIQNSTVYNE